MKPAKTPRTKAMKINLVCICGRELDVLTERLKDVPAVAKAQDWRVIGALTEPDTGALCPACNAATTAVEKIESAR